MPRASSVYGKEMRSLFGAGPGSVFYGFDFASLEARIMAHYVHGFTDGVELGKTFIAEKPLDLHTKMSSVMGIPRSEAKSINYGIIYGANFSKVSKMTGKSKDESKNIVDSFWTTAIALKEFKDSALKIWEDTGKKYVPALDGRKIFIRSSHAILNMYFQSAGVIFAKYVTVLLMQKMEKDYGFCIDPFIADPDVALQIEVHDELCLRTKAHLYDFKVFDTEEEAEDFAAKWTGSQLSAISKGKNSKFFICLPNPISEATIKTMREVEKYFNIKVEMGMEYMVGNTWYDCH